MWIDVSPTLQTMNSFGLPFHYPGTDIPGMDLYDLMKGEYTLTKNELEALSFPRPSNDGSNRAMFYTEKKEENKLGVNEKLCRRCEEKFSVYADGTPVNEQKCLYHWGKKRRKKVHRKSELNYQCCDKKTGSEGCTVTATHVHENNRHDDLDGYIKTLSVPDPDPRNHSIFAMDGEMVFTKAGMELARITLVGVRFETVYESLIKPCAEIVDYNTRFSGIKEEDMRQVTKSLCDVQNDIQRLVSDKTILIGHSLDHDLVKLKLIHNTIVDTSVVFPHEMGLPKRKSLCDLTTKYLNKSIQDHAGGHDSKEDAVACMELMIYKVSQREELVNSRGASSPKARVISASSNQIPNKKIKTVKE